LSTQKERIIYDKDKRIIYDKGTQNDKVVALSRVYTYMCTLSTINHI